MTHPSDTAGAVEKIVRDLTAAIGDHKLGSFRVDVSEIRTLLSLNATLQGRLDLAVGALERLCGLEYPSREEHDSAWAYAQETLSKIKEGANP